MSHREPNEALIDRAVDEIQNETLALEPAAEDAALRRAWQAIATEAAGSGAVLDCEAIQSLLPAYLHGALTEERRLLVEDHTRTCVPCRRALKAAREGKPAAVAAAEPVRTRGDGWKWAVAAMVLLALGVGQFLVGRAFWPKGDAARNMMRVVEGAVFQVSDASVQALEPGAAIPYGTEIVAPRGQSAMLTLADGSRVEMKERSRLSVRQGRGGTTIDLAGGNVIVEAADQREGHLWVATGDALVSVTGTVFAVHSGTKGSRVSVFEGEVHVDDRRSKHVLHPGGQVTTAHVRPVAFADEISWSAHSEQHLALLAELSDLNAALRTIDRPDVRYQASFLERLPASTVLYVAAPNLTGTIQESMDRVRAQVAESEVLQQWVGDGESLERAADLVERLAALGENLGDEIVVAGWQEGAERAFVGPAAVAGLERAGAFRARLEEEIARIAAESGGTNPIRIVDDPWAADLPEDDALLVWMDAATVVAAPGRQALQGMVATLTGRAPTLAGGSFHDTVADRYAQGVDVLVSIDLHELVLADQDAEQQARLDRLGIADVEQLTMEQWIEDGMTRRHAVLTFQDTRRGIASWLAAPGPMGSLSFFSPDATSAAAFVVKEPRLLFADLLTAMTDAERQELFADLQQFEAEHGWSLEADLFAPLGGEIAFGLDGPVLPTPSWKVVVEVYDPTRLQTGIERLLGEAAGKLAEEGQGTLEIATASVGGREAWQVRHVTPEGGVTGEAWWTYADGYLVATPSEALLDRALRYRSAGLGLLSSPKLKALLPTDEQVNFSALWYQDFASLIGPLAEMGQSLDGLPPAVRSQAEELAATFGPSLVYAYGQDASIVVSAASAHNPLALFQLFLMQGTAGVSPFGSVGGMVAEAAAVAEPADA